MARRGRRSSTINIESPRGYGGYRTQPTDQADSPLQYNEGPFPKFVGEMPPEPYQYDPRQEYNPEDFGPMPPMREKEYLLLDENNPAPAYLPNNPDGSISSEPGPPPPPPKHYFATNVPETAQKWSKQGQDYTYLAESPQAMQTAKEIGAPKVMRGYRDEDVPKPSPFGPEPKPEELDEMSKFKDFWGTHVNEKYGGKDPLTVNPSEEGVKAEEAARKEFALEMLNNGPETANHKMYEKRVAERKKDAVNKAEWQRRIGEEDHKMSQQFFKQAYAAKQKAPKEIDTIEHVKSAQDYMNEMLKGPQSWRNFDLTPEEIKNLGETGVMPPGKKLKPGVLDQINNMLIRAGMPKVTEQEVKGKLMQERSALTPWGPSWGPAKQYNEPSTYSYGQTPAATAAGKPSPEVVRTGTLNGRRVVQYSDGRTEYAR